MEMGENEQRTCALVGILPFIKEQKKKIDARGRGGAEPQRQRMRMGQAPWAATLDRKYRWGIPAYSS